MTFLEKCIPASVCAAIEVLMFTCPFSTRVCLLALTRALGCAFTDNGILWMLIFGGKEYFQPLSYSVININHIYLQIDIINIYSKTLHWIREWWCGCNLFFFTQRDKRGLWMSTQKKKSFLWGANIDVPGLAVPKHMQGITRNDPNWWCLFTDLFGLWKITSTC